MKAALVLFSIFAITARTSAQGTNAPPGYDVFVNDFGCAGNLKNLNPDEVNIMQGELLGRKIKSTAWKKPVNIQIKCNAQKNGVEDMQCYTRTPEDPLFWRVWNYDPNSNKLIKETTGALDWPDNLPPDPRAS